MIRHAPSIGIGIGLSLRGSGVGFSGLLDQYAGAVAAYSLRALSSGWLAGDVVEVRPSHGAAAQSFTESQITSGAMLDFVNNGTTDLYNSARYFNGTSADVNFGDVIDKDGSSAFYAEAIIISMESSLNQQILSKGASSDDFEGWGLRMNGAVAGDIQFVIGSTALNRMNVNTGDVGVNDGQPHSVRVEYDGSKSASGVVIKVDGVTKPLNIVTDNFTGSAANTRSFTVGSRDSANLFFGGIIYGIDYNGELVTTGLGTSVTAWEDTIGNNDGTEANGAAYTGQPFDGFVSTWYDQSGNANNATQITTTAQPKIVSAGALVTGGLDFDGVNDRLTCSSMYSADLSVFATATTNNTVNTANYMRMFHICDGVDSFQITRGGGVDTGLLCSKNTSFQAGIDAFKHGAINGENLITTITSAIETDAYVDGLLGSNSATDLGSGNSAITTIGARDDLSASTFFAGSFAELIVYASDQSANRAAIETNINAAYSIYA